MHFKQYLVAIIVASSAISALPAPDVVDLAVCARNDQSASCLRKKSAEDTGTEYKRSVDLDAVCARNDQSASCLRKKEAEADLDTAVCARNDESKSCLRKKS